MSSPSIPVIDERTGSGSGLLTRLSPSPSVSSSSSFTSSSSFDPHANPDEKGDHDRCTTGPTRLGLRELAKMRREDKRARKATTGASTNTTSASATADSYGNLGNRERRSGEVKLVSSVIGAGTDLPFAMDVQIKGWKVVGGKSWTDIGRVGAYVGMYPMSSDLRRLFCILGMEVSL